MDPVEKLNLLEIGVRLAAAGAIGSVLGIERRLHNKPAGMRTHALVALGSALFALIGLHLELPGGAGEQAFGHVIQGIITGIGFLGGGAILKEGQTVHGLATGASVWIVAGLGLACGAGYWRVGLIAMLFALALLLFGGWIEHAVKTKLDSWIQRLGLGTVILYEPTAVDRPMDAR
jgi:putative Mg2+ transporter-C (MgtC) family protein